jgi:hypothetical protein
MESAIAGIEQAMDQVLVNRADRLGAIDLVVATADRISPLTMEIVKSVFARKREEWVAQSRVTCTVASFNTTVGRTNPLWYYTISSRESEIELTDQGLARAVVLRSENTSTSGPRADAPDDNESSSHTEDGLLEEGDRVTTALDLTDALNAPTINSVDDETPESSERRAPDLAQTTSALCTVRHQLQGALVRMQENVIRPSVVLGSDDLVEPISDKTSAYEVPSVGERVHNDVQNEWKCANWALLGLLHRNNEFEYASTLSRQSQRMFTTVQRTPNDCIAHSLGMSVDDLDVMMTQSKALIDKLCFPTDSIAEHTESLRDNMSNIIKRIAMCDDRTTSKSTHSVPPDGEKLVHMIGLIKQTMHQLTAFQEWLVGCQLQKALESHAKNSMGTSRSVEASDADSSMGTDDNIGKHSREVIGELHMSDLATYAQAWGPGYNTSMSQSPSVSSSASRKRPLG